MKNLLYLLIVLSVVYNCGSDYEDPALEDDYEDWAKSEFEDDNGDLTLDDDNGDLTLDDDFDDLSLDDDFDDLSLDDLSLDDESGYVDNEKVNPDWYNDEDWSNFRKKALHFEWNKIMPERITYSEFESLLLDFGVDNVADMIRLQKQVLYGPTPGKIYTSHKYGSKDKLIGHYINGKIYTSHKYGSKDKLIGHYIDGKIYTSHKYGSKDKLIGHYDSSGSGAAAAAFLLLFGYP